MEEIFCYIDIDLTNKNLRILNDRIRKILKIVYYIIKNIKKD
jgi:hypothetical protein